MHLSTSSSEAAEGLTDPFQSLREPRPLPRSPNRSVRWATIALLSVVAGVYSSAEFASRILFPRISHIQRRIVQDQKDVRAKATAAPDGPATVLLVGNSLLLYALDYPRLTAALSPHIRPVRYAIENTNYLDWYYGLKGLFSDGVRPTEVLLCLNLGQTLDRGILGDFSARHLFRANDLLAVAREAGMDNTRTSGLVFAHWSAFYADRVHIRNYIMNISDRPYGDVMNALARVPPNFPPDDEALRETRVRLRAIMRLCQEYDVNLLFVVPPSLKRRDELIMRAGSIEGVSVVTPIPLGSLGTEYFMDGFHLNQNGAALFTDALADDLKRRLTQDLAPEGVPNIRQ